MQSVERPVVRSFKARFVREAARHVRSGGHAILWETATRARLVFRQPKPRAESDLGEWAMLDLGRSRFTIVGEGPLRGLASCLVPREHFGIVERWAERDSVWPGPTRQVRFDCFACGACCRSNEVVLQRDDIARFRRAKRDDLYARPFARRRSDGKIVLTLLQSKDCRHLQADNRCDIYELRPNACSTFPVASECCMFAREEELGVTDGLPR
jgi:Fe-S-cluster containining protein